MDITTENGATILPDGSAFAVLSMPLPADHWLTAPGEFVNGEQFMEPPPMLLRMGTDDPRRHEFADAIRTAVRYALRAVTRRGADIDFDPDALVQNAVVGALGYHTPDGLSDDGWANPPAPERRRGEG